VCCGRQPCLSTGKECIMSAMMRGDRCACGNRALFGAVSRRAWGLFCAHCFKGQAENLLRNGYRVFPLGEQS
jgi:hypothetical protein